MGRRIIKKRIKNVILIVSMTIFIVVAGFLLFNILKSLPSFFKVLDAFRSKQIVKPVGISTGVDEIKEKLEDKNIILDEIQESSSSSDLIIGKIRDGPQVYFSASKDINWQVTSLVLILSKIAIDNKKPVYIDLRYERPIVKF